MEPFAQRVIDEKKALDESILKLSRFIGTEVFKNLSERQQELLRRQLNVMGDYSYILGERIKLF